MFDLRTSMDILLLQNRKIIILLREIKEELQRG